MATRKPEDHVRKNRTRKEANLPKDVQIITDHKVKMSEIILGFINPLLNDFIRSEEKLYKFVIDIAVVAWNASFLPEDKISELMEKHATIQAGNQKMNFEEMFTMLIRRKRKLYVDNRNIIVEYDFSRKGDSYIFNVMSTPSQDQPGE